ncbi:MAG TPA: phytoene/squalene synthase family protein [Chthoniobacterales bacterium]|nr:phytoene/squalene synthase family protein [Chthoniobacterales bacterium]
MNAAKITRQSKSNLALAFFVLGRERRRDITTFYAFCRVIDDIVDASQLTTDEKARHLARWRQMLRAPVDHEPALARDMRELIEKYALEPALLEEIVAGVEMDLSVVRYETFDQLRVYCYRVASAVGLVSIEIFRYRNPASKDYAIQLGLALQMTNIIRDVGKDLRDGRIYLPQEDLARFHYAEAELQNRQYNERFVRLMEFEAARAHEFFGRAATLLPSEDRRAMVAAETMSSIYRTLLRRIQRDGFRVFDKDYHLSTMEKGSRIALALLKSF